jgi:hypothetical protein
MNVWTNDERKKKLFDLTDEEMNELIKIKTKWINYIKFLQETFV